tara:strand:- start:845 stop:1018 length:174 start_codon:yes stop_codon:yes gene_type:complete
MKMFNARIVEKFGYKAHKGGFFKEWQKRSTSISSIESIGLDIASEKAYNILKLEGDE